MAFVKDDAKNWYVVYTRSRTEKKVRDELEMKGIESFLPLQKKLRQWKDRKKWVEMPLFSGYCFVHINRADYERVLQISHVVCYITFEGKAAVVRNDQIEALRQLLNQNDFNVEITHETFEVGKKVEIIRGPLVGLRGELVEIRGKRKFLLRIEQIDKSLLVEVPSDILTAIPKSMLAFK